MDSWLWFSGERCSQKYYVRRFRRSLPLTSPNNLPQGFLHGDYFEGRDAGEELSQCIKGGGCAAIRQHYEEVKDARPYEYS